VTGKALRSTQVRNLLVAHFIEQGLTPGDKLPSEAEIAALGQVGRSTAREALKLLEQEGLVTVRRGQGRFLSSLSAHIVERPITQFESATDMLAALGYDARTITLSVEERPATEDERQALKLTASEAIICVERLRSSSDVPLIYSVCTMPRWCIAGPIVHVNWTNSLNQLLAAQGYAPASSSARLKAVNLPSAVAHQYSLNGSEPWLLIAETVVTDSGLHILYAEDYHRGDAFAFNVLRKP
jgi:GntR family transcriptional regulator